MRSATNNRFIAPWIYYPTTGACSHSHQLWSWAEITAQQVRGGNPDYPLGSYNWPTVDFELLGPTKANANGSCAPQRQNAVLVTAEPTEPCTPVVRLCIGPSELAGCGPENWAFKYGFNWERSLDNGVSWFRFADTAVNLTGNRITIGNECAAVIDDTARNTGKALRSQFCGIIDSVRISRGVSRYTANVCQPYNPSAPEETLIDDNVIFALNLGDDPLRVPGGSEIRYYVRDRGWLVPGTTLYGSTATPFVVESIRKLYDVNFLLPAESQYVNVSRVITRDGVTETKTVNFRTAHQLLTYSNRTAGYRNRCGIQFPVLNHMYAPDSLASASVFQALALEDFTLPPHPDYLRTITVNFATTKNITPDFTGGIVGNKREVDEDVIDLSNGSLRYDVLIKNQDFPVQNGIYKTAKSFKNGDNVELHYWERIADQTGETLEPDNYNNLTIRVAARPTNIGTQWHSITPSPRFGETEIQFVQEQLLGTYKDDFCVEAYFKVPSFLHPSVQANATSAGHRSGGENMTLIDTYYREDREQGIKGVGSGIRIYFNPLDGGKIGRAFVDIGNYSRDGSGGSSNSAAVPAITDADDGPALRSCVLDSNKFYHIAVTRERDTFRLYIDGVLQDTLILQEKKFEPAVLTKDDNDILYRGRGYMGRRLSKPTHNQARIVIKDAEFFFSPKSFSYAYAKRFNGAAGMIESPSSVNNFLNIAPDNPTIGTWPGAPVPDRPSDSHIYLFNDITIPLDDVGGGGTQYPITFVVQPAVRFPPDTLYADLATVPEDTKYIDNTGTEVLIPAAGNITLANLLNVGSKALGIAVITFNSAVTGLQATLTNSSTTVTLTSGTTANLVVGQALIKTGGTGAFGASVTIASITNSSTFVVNIAHATSGAVTFSATQMLLTIDNTARLIANGVQYKINPANPSQSYKTVRTQAEVVTATDLFTHINGSQFFIYLPVIATSNTADGNLPAATALSALSYPDGFYLTQGVAGFVVTGYESDGVTPTNYSGTYCEDGTYTYNGTTRPKYRKAGTDKYIYWLNAYGMDVWALNNDDSFSLGTFGNVFSESNASTPPTTGWFDYSTSQSVTVTATRCGDVPSIASISASTDFYGGVDGQNTPQIVDGILLEAGMRILVKDQTDKRQNGIYIASEGPWLRVDDFKNNSQLKLNQRVLVTNGFTNCSQAFALSFGTIPPGSTAQFGVTNLIFAESSDNSASGDSFQVAGQKSTVAGTGLEIADELAVIVAAVTTQNITLSGYYGGATVVGSGNSAIVPAFDNAPANKFSVSTGVRILVRQQTNEAENGIYLTNAGAWRRDTAFDSSAELVAAHNLLVAPQAGASADFPYGYRLQTISYVPNFQFVVDETPITVSEPETLTKLYLPTTWSNVFIGKRTDIDSGLTLTGSGTPISWNDYLNSGSHRTVWRLKFQCGKTIAYSRNLILYSATRAGIVSLSPIKIR